MNIRSAPVLFGIMAGVAAALALREGVAASPAARSWLESSVDPLRRARIEGYLPTSKERLRLSFLAALAAIVLGWYMGGPWLAVILVALAPALAGLVVTRSRRRYSRQVEAALPDAARAVADGLSAGHSPRGALEAAAVSLDGAAAVEFGRVRHDLESGLSTTAAIEALADRFRSARVDAFSMAMVSQSVAGGDLAGLLRRFAEGAAERDRVHEDARAATAQARFTGYLVVSMPAGAALFTEILSPGFLASLTGSVPAMVLLGMAAILQTVGFLAIGRLARMDDV